MTAAASVPPDPRRDGAPAPASVEPHVFLDRVRPLLNRADCDALAECLNDMGGASRIVPLLHAPDSDVRKVAALALSLVGDRSCVDHLSTLLKQRDPVIGQMAEHALWSIWCRLGTDAANRELARGADLMNARELAEAEKRFTRAIDLCPTFAEAYNQRAIVRYLLDDADGSEADNRQAVRLMPEHFGAWSGLGHCHVQAGRFDAAAGCYRRALEINPHLASVAEMLRELDTLEADPGDADVT